MRSLLHLSCIAWMMIAVPASARDALKDLQPIIERGTLVFATLSRSLPPMIQVDGEGGVEGFDVRLANEVAAALGVKADIRATAGTQWDIIDDVVEGKADIGIGYLPQTVTAGRYVYLTQPYLFQKFGMLVNREEGRKFFRYCPGLEDVENLVRSDGRVGLLDFSLYEPFVGRIIPGARTRDFVTMEEIGRAVEKGEIVAAFIGEVASKYYLVKRPQAALRLKVCDLGNRSDPIVMAVRPDAPDLLRWLNLFIAQRGAVVDLDQVIYQEDVATF